MKKFLLLTIFVLVAAGCGIVQNKVVPNDATPVTSTQEQSQIPSGWQVYDNQKFNYQIAYPTNLKTGEYCIAGEIQHGVSVPSDYEFSCNLNIVSGENGDFMIMVVDGLNVNGNFSIPGTDFTPNMRLGEARPNYVLQDIAQNLTKVGYQQLASTTLDGLQVVRFTYNSNTDGSHDFWYFVKNGYLYFIEFTPSEHNSDLRLQILKTLKFF